MCFSTSLFEIKLRIVFFVYRIKLHPPSVHRFRNCQICRCCFTNSSKYGGHVGAPFASLMPAKAFDAQSPVLYSRLNPSLSLCVLNSTAPTLSEYLIFTDSQRVLMFLYNFYTDNAVIRRSFAFTISLSDPKYLIPHVDSQSYQSPC